MNLLLRNTLRKIKKSSGRYISLLIIVMVGVGFFAGIRESTPDIRTTLSEYNQRYQLTDFKVVSTMGLTADDVNAVAALDGVKEALGSYSLDVLDGAKAIRVHALTDNVNSVELVHGRMPESDTECVADAIAYDIGDTVSVSGDNAGDLKNTTFTVVGTVISPLYLASNYGSSSVGNGKLSSFIFVNADNFDLDTYTEIYVIAAKSATAADFSDAYVTLTAKINRELKAIAADREAARYHEIYDEANAKIDDGEKTLNEETASAKTKLNDAKEQLDEGKAKLNSAKATLTEQEAALEESAAKQTADFDAAQKQLDSARAQLDGALTGAGLSEGTLAGKIAELNSAVAGLQQQQSQLDPAGDAYAALSAQISALNSNLQGLLQLKNGLDALNAQQSQLDQGIAAFHAKIAAARDQLDAGKAEIASNEATLAKGYTTYNENLAIFQTKTADAKQKLADARAGLADIKDPNWTVQDREDLVAGYGDLKSGTDTIVSVAAVFPLFFILIVALMTSNTMARMIEEERGEIGALTSLGFHDDQIMTGYLFYVISATVLGALLGYFAGCTFIPKIIFACFPTKLSHLVITYDPLSFLVILAIAVALMTVVTVIFCKEEMKQRPALLLRPVPPKKGQKILLEKVGFVWNHLSFTWKVTLRNIFRYKRRVFMTVIGIAGCTALLLTGFGLKDCLTGVAQKQYQDIFCYDQLIVLKNAVSGSDEELDQLLAAANAKDPLLLKQTAFTCESAKKSLECYVVVPEDSAVFPGYFNLTGTDTGKNLKLGKNRVIVTERIAEIYNLSPGDTFTVADSDGNDYKLTVGSVAENYIGNYVYMDKELYETVFGASPKYNMIVTDVNGNAEVSAQTLLGNDRVVNVNLARDILSHANVGYKSLNGVVVLIVFIATILAVVVLYNLTSINISERKREIATLKVLGFSDAETNEYIYRETFLLTLLSTVIGLFLGIGLHHFLMSVIQRDGFAYFHQIKALSYLWAFLITMVTSGLMQAITYFKLKGIDMIESLKSVE